MRSKPDQNKSPKKIDIILAIQNLLQEHAVGTQEEISAALHKQGLDVNQVKISRVLHKIGAIKVNEGGHVVYRLPNELMTINPNDSMKQLILKISHNESLIVIKTAPGCAQFVARFLDQSKDLKILGTVAGDDTIFIAPEKIPNIKQTHQLVYRALIGG